MNYNESIKKVEDILRKVEDPDTGVEESSALIGEARKLLDSCYAYLREERKECEAED